MRYVDDTALPEVSDEAFKALRERARPYTVLILGRGPNFPSGGPSDEPGAWAVLMEHGKRNARLHQAGLMPIVCPIGDGSAVKGIGVFDAGLDDVERIMAEDPAVKAGMLTYELHASRSFPGSTLREPVTE